MCFASKGKRVEKREIRTEGRPNQVQLLGDSEESTDLFVCLFILLQSNERGFKQRNDRISENIGFLRRHQGVGSRSQGKNWVLTFEVSMKCAKVSQAESLLIPSYVINLYHKQLSVS